MHPLSKVSSLWANRQADRSRCTRAHCWPAGRLRAQSQLRRPVPPCHATVVGVTSEQELADALMDKERYIRLDAHIGLTGQFQSQQVGSSSSSRSRAGPRPGAKEAERASAGFRQLSGVRPSWDGCARGHTRPARLTRLPLPPGLC